MNIGDVHIALKAIDFWALFACIGLLAVRIGLLPLAAFSFEDVARRWRRWLGLSLAVLTVTGLALLPIRIMEMGKSSAAETLSILPVVLQQTHFGQVWSVHLFGLLLLWIGWATSTRGTGRGAAAFMLTVAALTAWTYSASSHAGDSGDFTLAELCDWVHVLSASTWGGGILASVLFLSIFRKQPSQYRALMGDMVGRLSTLSAVALMLVLASGIYNVASRLDNVGELLSTPYGNVLGIKLILVAIMASIGAANRLILVPKFQQWAAKTGEEEGRPMQRIIATLRVDVLLVLLILCAAAVLIQSMPPAVMKTMPGMSHRHSQSMQ